MEAPAETVRSAAPTPEPIMGDDEAALLRLWREKRCEVEAIGKPDPSSSAP